DGISRCLYPAGRHDLADGGSAGKHRNVGECVAAVWAGDGGRLAVIKHAIAVDVQIDRHAGHAGLTGAVVHAVVVSVVELLAADVDVAEVHDRGACHVHAVGHDNVVPV